jgi:IPT/TIG domain
VTGSATGGGTLKLRVVEGGPEGGWIGSGTSAPATSFRGFEGPPNATSLPIDVGDAIGVDLTMNSTVGEDLTEGEAQLWTPPLVDGEVRNGVEDIRLGSRIELSAEEVLTPVVTLLSPASGSAAGGNAVKIAGLYLNSATGVTFGSTPASSFSVDSSNQITAIAPASTASTVDVHVTGPGGSSAIGAGDRYTFTAPATTTTTTTLAPVLGPALAPAKPTVSGFGQSASRWRRGRSLPRISSAGAPLGTTFSFSLSEPATASFAFTQRVAGRRVGGRCVSVGQRNVGKPKCKRTVSVGSFGLTGHAGLNKVRFQGRVSGAKTLKLGAYRVVISARDAQGLQSLPQTLSFTIVPG